jgi:DnaJ-class molecular chaperone
MGLEGGLDKKVEKIRTKCPKCNGVGYINNVRCETCKGSGQTTQQ